MKKSYKISVDCPVNRTEGVKSASVNFMSLKMNVEFENDVEDHEKVMRAVLENCRDVDDDIEIFF